MITKIISRCQPTNLVYRTIEPRQAQPSTRTHVILLINKISVGCRLLS